MNLILLEVSELVAEHRRKRQRRRRGPEPHDAVADDDGGASAKGDLFEEAGDGGEVEGDEKADDDDDDSDSQMTVVMVRLDGRDRRAKHIVNHLKKQKGDTVLVGVLGGHKYQASIVDIGTSGKSSSKGNPGDVGDHGAVTLELPTFSSPGILNTAVPTLAAAAAPPTTPQPTITITVVLAMPFPARLKYLWPVISSMGVVDRILIVRGVLSDPAHLESKVLQQPSVYEPLLYEGLSQGCHTRLPIVSVDVREVLSETVLERLGLYGDGDVDEANDNDGGNKGGSAAAPVAADVHNSSPRPVRDCVLRPFVSKIFLDCGDETMTPPPVREVVWEQFHKDQQQQGGFRRHDKKQKHEQHEFGEGAGEEEDSSPVGPSSTPLSQSSSPSPVVSAIIAVGPERGWTDSEATLFGHAGFQPALLGPAILRVDTAVVAGIATTQAALEGLAAVVGASSSSSWSSQHIIRGD